MKISRNNTGAAHSYEAVIFPFIDDEDSINGRETYLQVYQDEATQKPVVRLIDPGYYLMNESLSLSEVNQLASALQTAVGEMLTIKHLIKQERNNENHS